MEEKKIPQGEAENTEHNNEAGSPGAADEPGSAVQGSSPGQVDLPETEGEETAGEQGQEEVDVQELERRLAEQTALAQDYFQRLARMQADFENYRRRMNREREEWFKYASQSLVAELLPVVDNFERALAAKEDDPAQVVAGVEMIYRQLMDVLTREGLSPVPAVNEPFDPARHEAIMQEETDSYPDNTVIEELRRGYYFKDRLLRPALVKVARAVSKQENNQ
ncbi:MAG: molecular chaperone GrpE [Thermoanaerobacter sp.]|jgi:molecular chaperone GrpE|uniref:nucleotide exchange factor GrpE n=1 Tax=Desulfofundulus thermocisternus TaxID=42471 RepID=UPI00055761F4|nr:nucleotide exchange factor GrpE [Desulfofundulus thermocisternus]MDK2888006.1 molecular chaperone GrpE [Thermoanaerobacter sp.]